MSVWNRNNPVNRLVRQNNFLNQLVSGNNPSTMALEEAPRTLMDRIFLDRVCKSSCITLPAPTGNHFEIHPSHINILPKFGIFDNNDPYIFLTKFEQAGATMKFQQLCDDEVTLGLMKRPDFSTLENRHLIHPRYSHANSQVPENQIVGVKEK